MHRRRPVDEHARLPSDRAATGRAVTGRHDGPPLALSALLDSGLADDETDLVLAVLLFEDIAIAAVIGFIATGGGGAGTTALVTTKALVFVAGSLAWGMVVDGFRPDRWDLTGALVCLVGVALIMYGPRAAG